MLSDALMLRQYARHSHNLSTGDKVVAIQDGLFDLFTGLGFANPSRFRIVKIRRGAPGTADRQLIQVNGKALDREYRERLLKECQ